LAAVGDIFYARFGSVLNIVTDLLKLRYFPVRAWWLPDQMPGATDPPVGRQTRSALV